MGVIFTMVPQLVSHQLPGFLQTLNHLMVLPTDILCRQKEDTIVEISCPQLFIMHGLLVD